MLYRVERACGNSREKIHTLGLNTWCEKLDSLIYNLYLPTCVSSIQYEEDKTAEKTWGKVV